MCIQGIHHFGGLTVVCQDYLYDLCSKSRQSILGCRHKISQQFLSYGPVVRQAHHERTCDTTRHERIQDTDIESYVTKVRLILRC